MNQSGVDGTPKARRAGSADQRWRRDLAELALACAGSFPAEEAQRLRELRRLIAAAPLPALVRGLAVPNAVQFEDLLGADATASAALALLGGDCGYLLSRGLAGQHLASVILPGTDDETSAGGDTLALALVGAVALALAEPRDSAAQTNRPAARSARLN